MEIIEAEKEHIDSIVKLHKELTNFYRRIDKYYRSGNKEIQKEFKKYLLENFYQKNFKILIALEKEKVVGYFIGKIEKSKFCTIPEKVGKIASAFVLEKYQRKNIEKQIFEKILEWFKTNKIKHIELSVDSKNKIGIRAWKKFGFFEYQKKIYRNYLNKKLNKFKLSDLMISIETSNICNAKCIICPYQKMTRKKEIMPMVFFKKVVNNCLAYGVKNFNLIFYNEPFLDPVIFERIKYLKSKKARVQLFSNGSVIDSEKTENILESGLDEIIFSIDAAKKETYELIRRGLVFEKTINNILNLIKRKRKLGLEKPKIKLNFTKQKLNEAELEEFRSFWVSKVDEISVSVNDGRNEISEPFARKKKSFASFPCLRLWREFIVMSNGKVPLCCIDYDGKIILGDFNTQNLKEIWNSDNFRKIRQLHLNFKADKISLCKKCLNSYRINIRRILRTRPWID